MTNNIKTPGKLIFAEIPRLPDNWWEPEPTAPDPAIVWTKWEKDNFYLWGANIGNYKQAPIGTSLHGGGMAGASHGPTIGRQHPHFIGVITMDKDQMSLNDPVFTNLAALVAEGKNVVIPIFQDHHIQATGYKLSLGTGIGSNIPHWLEIQKYLLCKIYDLGQECSSVEIKSGVYWPNLKDTPPGIHDISSLADLGALAKSITPQN